MACLGEHLGGNNLLTTIGGATCICDAVLLKNASMMGETNFTLGPISNADDSWCGGKQKLCV